MAKLGLALCITDLDLGGAERCLTELAVRVDRQRFTPVVYCLAGLPRREEASCMPELKKADVPVHCLGARNVWQFPVVACRLRRLLLAQKPQVIQTFLFHANIVGRIAARRTGVRAVVSGIRVAERRSAWHLWMDRMTASWVDRYVCVSRSVADFSAGRGGIRPEKLVVIPNGIDVSRYESRVPADLSALGIPTGSRLVTFVGRFEPQKGVSWLIETAPNWLARLPGCELLLVGEGPLRDRLEATCRAGGIAGRVHFAGWRSDVPEILAASHLLVLPSAWEGMPNIALEAMASGLPMVATDVEGVRELLGPAGDEQIVRYADSQALGESIVKFVQNRELSAAIGKENRRQVKETFPISRMLLAYESLWESLATG